VECLADGNYHRRVAARDELAKLGEKAIEPLTEAIADGRLLVRLSAAETLGRMDLPAARERLKALLASEEKLLAYCAADALACLRDEDIAGMWTKLLSSEDFYLRAAAAEALGRTRRGEFAAALMARLDDPRAEVRRKAIWALGEIRAPASVDALFERFVNRRGGLRSAKEVYASYQEYMLDVDELRDALVKIGPPAVSRLIPAVEYGWSPLQEKAQEALVKIGAPAVEPLIKALDSPEPDTKSAAAKVLSRLRPPEAIGPLISHTGGTSFVEAEAFRALAAYGEVARGKLEQALADPKLNLLAKASAGALLVNLEDRSGLVFLEDVVRGGTAQEMNSIVGLMGVLRRREFLPLIGEALERPDAWQGVTYAAAYCGGVEALPMLQKARNHANEGVRTGAEDWVRRLAPPGR
jgi:HEAT repeat protein